MRYIPGARNRWQLSRREAWRWKDLLFERWGEDLRTLYQLQPLTGTDGQPLPLITWPALLRLVREMEQASRDGRRWLEPEEVRR